MGAVKQQLYDVAVAGQGFVLVGDPTRPSIKVSQQPVFGNRFAQGDRDLQDFSFWWFWSQRDFSAGLKDEKLWLDDAKFYSGEAVDTFSEPGAVRVLSGQTSVEEFDISRFDRITSAGYGTVLAQVIGLIGLQGISPSEKSAIFSTIDGVTYTEITDAGMASDGRAILGIRITPLGRFVIASASNGAFAFSTYNGTSHSDITGDVTSGEAMGTNGNAQGVEVVGSTVFFFHRNNARELIVTSTPDFTTYTKQHEISGGFYKGSCALGSKLLYVVSVATSIIELHEYDTVNDTDTVVFTWKGQTLNNLIGAVTPTNSGAASGSCIGTADGKNAFIVFDSGEVWKYDGSEMSRIYTDPAGVVGTNLGLGFVLHEGSLVAPNLTISFDGTVHPGYKYLQFNSFPDVLPAISMRFPSDSSTFLYSSNDFDSTSERTLYRHENGSQIGVVLTSEHDGGVPGIDKLYRSVVLEFDTLTTAGQIIEVSRSTDGGSTFTSLGSVSFNADGAVSSREFFFGDALISKKMILRFTLTKPASATGSPVLRSYSVRFLPVPDYRLRWDLVLNCSDRIQLKDGKTLEPKTGEELRNMLRRAWWTKEVISFEDVDASTLVLGADLTADATSLTLQQTTYNLAERGRIRIGDEEILYAGKNQNQLLNLVRGARGTVGVAHSTGDSVTTAYEVIITDYQDQLIIANRSIDREYRTTLQLIEA